MSRAVVSRVPPSAPPRRPRPPKPSRSPAPPPEIPVGIVPGRRAILGGFLAGLLARTSPPASASATASCARDPPDIAAVLALARELYGDGRLDEADLLLTTAASCSRTDPIPPESSRASSAPLLKLLGDVRVDALRYARAVEAYDAALDADPAGPSAPGAHFGRANAFEGLASEARAEAEAESADADADAESRRLYALAVDDYSRCVELAPEAAEVSTAYFERAQAERALGRWKDAREDYDAAATLFLARREKKFADVSDAQAAFATFETGDLTRARARLETLGRRLYSSDVRAALVACYWRMGEGALAEDAWSKLCEMEDSRCGKYGDRDWLLSYRRWTPGLADAMEDFLALRVRPGWGGEGWGESGERRGTTTRGAAP